MCFGNSDYRDGETTVVEAVEVQPDIANEVAAEFGQNSIIQKRLKVLDKVAYILALATSAFVQGKSPEEAVDVCDQVLVNMGIPTPQRRGILSLVANEGERLAGIVDEVETRHPGVLTSAF